MNRTVYFYSFSLFFARRKFVNINWSLYLMLGDFLGIFFQDAQIPVARDNKFCTATPVLMGSQYRSCFMLPFWWHEFWGGFYVFENVVRRYITQ